MPISVATKRAILRGTPMRYLLDDEFHRDLAAGSVNGTGARPGPGTRAVVSDTASAISIAAGVLDVDGGANNWTGARYRFFDEAVTRVAGQMLILSFEPKADKSCLIGFGTVNNPWAASKFDAALQQYSGEGIRIIQGEAAEDITYFAPTLDTAYRFAIVLRSTGAYFFVKGGVFTNWELFDIAGTGNTTPLYVASTSYHSTHHWHVDYARLPARPWLPTPLAYDTFTRANGAIGTSEATGPDSQFCTARTWTGATATVASNVAVVTPTAGAEDLANGNMESGDPPTGWGVWNATNDGVADERTGGAGSQSLSATNAGAWGFSYQALAAPDATWVIATGWAKNVSATYGIFSIGTAGGASNIGVSTFTGSTWASFVVACRLNGASCVAKLSMSNTAGHEVRFDDLSVKPLTLNTLFTCVDDSATSDAIVTVELDAVTQNTQAGIVMNLDDKDTPANFVLGYITWDDVGFRVKLDKCVAGIYTSVISATATYAAGGTVRVIKSGTSYSLYYRGNQIGATSTVSDAGIINNTLHGLFSTYASNTLNDFCVFARGSDNEYRALDDF